MKTLDRYVMRQLIIPILFCSLTLIFFLIIVDLFDNLQEFIRNKTHISDILVYYLCLIPYAFVQTISWATLLGTVYLLVNLNMHNEILAMKVTGHNITRISLPIIYLGFIVGLTTFIVSDILVPPTYLKAQIIKEQKIKTAGQEKVKSFNDIACYGKNSVVYYIRTFEVNKKHLIDIIVLFLDKNGRLTRRIVAKEAWWVQDHWQFEGVTDYDTDEKGSIVGEPSIYPTKIYPEVREKPGDFINSARDKSLLRYKELKDYIRKLKSNRLKTYAEEVELQYKLSFPWQSLVMIFIVIPFLMRTASRKVIALNVLLCLGLVFCFHVISAVCLALGKSGTLFPFVSAWSGILIFTIGSVLAMERANY